MPLVFKSEEERKKHPKASLIPLAIWELVFHEKLTDEQLELLSSRISTLTLPENSQLADLLCVLIANNEMKDEELLAFFVRSKIPKDLVLKSLIIINKNQLALNRITDANVRLAFIAAVFANNIEMVKSILAEHPIDGPKLIISQNNYQLIYETAYYGYLELLDLMLTQTANLKTILQAYYNQVYRQALDERHLQIIFRLIQLGGLNNFIDEDENINIYLVEKTLFFAAETGNLQLFDKLLILFQDKDLIKDLIRKGANGKANFYLFQLAAAKGQVAFMEKLLSLLPEEKNEMIEANNFDAFIAAAEGGHLEVINKLVELATNKIGTMLYAFGDQILRPRVHYQAISYALKGGHLEVVQRLLELSKHPLEMVINNNYLLFNFCVYLDKGQSTIAYESLLFFLYFDYKMHFNKAMAVLYKSMEGKENLQNQLNNFPAGYLCDFVEKQLKSSNLIQFLKNDFNSLGTILSEEDFIKCIDVLERKGSPLAYLVCGLLLEGRLETNIPLRYQEDLDSKEYQLYLEKRVKDAISYYVKAAEDPTLKPIVSHLLWNLRVIGSDSIRNYLYFFDDLRPHEQVIPNSRLFSRESVSIQPWFFKQPVVHFKIDDQKNENGLSLQ